MLSERIYQFRRNSGLSQEQLAEKIGVSRQAISKWESGISTPELEKLLALSECFDITIDELVKDEAFTQGTNEVPQELEKTKDPKAIEMVLSPSAAEQLNAASTVTLSGSGILIILCVLSMVIGLALILRKK